MKQKRGKLVFYLVFVISIFFVSGFVPFTIQQESYSKTLERMNLTIKTLKEEGFNEQRFKDIYFEALNNNPDTIKDAIILFANLSTKLEILLQRLEIYKNSLKILEEYGIIIDNTDLMSAEILIKSGKYDDAEKYLDDFSKKIENASKPLYDTLNNDLEFIRKELIGISIDFNLDNYKIKPDLIQYSLFMKNIQEIKETIVLLKEMNRYLKEFESKRIEKDKIKDILSESIYFFKNNRYDKVKSLFSLANVYYNSIIECEIYLSRNDIGPEFNQKLEKCEQLFHRADEKCVDCIKELEKDILKFKSQQISQSAFRKEFKIKKEIIYGIFAIFIFSVLMIKPIQSFYRKKYLKALIKKKDALIIQMKRLQEDYYLNKKISKKRYKQQMLFVQKKFVETIRKIETLKDNRKDTKRK